MQINERYEDQATVFSLDGRLDASTAGQFRDRVKELLAKERSHLVVDLSEVGFVDSSGLGALLSALKALTQKGGDLKLCCLIPEVKSLFELTRLHLVFDIYSDVRSALAGF